MGVRKVIAGVVILLVVAVVVAAGVGAWATQRPLPDTGGTVEVDGLDGRVDVYRDAFGVPHLYADTATDLFAAQGYVHAQDRFWEMDVRRHTTAGRLSELFGESQIETDRFIRVLGWRHVAEQEWELLADETRAMFEAYADGVNAYLDGRAPGELSLEYAVLGLQRPGYEPEPWSPVDSVAWLKAMAWDLAGNHRSEIERVALTETLSVDRIEQLWPAFPYEDRAPILPQLGGATAPDEPRIGEPATTPDAATEGAPAQVVGEVLDERSAALSEARPLLRNLGAALAALPNLIGPPGAGLGSNSVVVSGDMTVTGQPLLANDPHLGPALPSIWHQMALHCRSVSDACPYAVQGTTFSGMPGVVIGHNDRIAWGFTNLSPDVSDLVLERLVPGGYEHRGGTLPLEQRTETIRVAGGDDVQVTIRVSGHGPLVSDVAEEMQETAARAPAAAGEPELAVALRWTALRPGRTADAILAVNRARSWDEFRDAAALFDVPAQNIVYADVDGNIGYQTPGWIPRRADDDDGRWPVPGWTGAHDWLGRVPFDELPSVLNPEEGFIVTANQPVVYPEVGPFISADQAYGWRSQRLRELMADRDSVAHEDLARMMMDTHNGIAETLVPLLVDVEVPAEVRDAQLLLAEWDLQQSANSAAGAYFAGVWRHVLLRTFADELPEGTEIDGGGRWMEVLRHLAADPDASWWNDLDTGQREGRDDMLRAAMIAAHAELSERLGDDPSAWRWGDVHVLDMRHSTLGASGVPPVERLFNREPVQVGGGGAILNANAWKPTNGYQVDWVPSMRIISDPSNWDASRWINLTGNSGHAFSPHYTDQAERWSSGDTIPMRWSDEAVRAAATDHLVLTPGGSAAERGS
jgi:penicillin amidase